MEHLTWILLLLGLGLLGGIYWYGKRQERQRPGSLLEEAGNDLGHAVRDDIDPLSDDLDELNRMINQRFEPAELDPEVQTVAIAERMVEPAPTTRSAPAPAKPEPAKAEPAPRRPSRPRTEPNRPASQATPGAEQIVVLHVAAPRGQAFHGPELIRLFESRDYRYGEMNIYHSMHDGLSLFSVANMVKPGWFDLAAIERFSTPGISLFMRLPGPHPAVAAFDILLTEARALSDDLGGVLQDADHSTLSQQTIQHLRERMVEFQARSRKLGGS